MNIQVTLLFITACVNSLLSLFVLLGKRDKTNIVYALFVLFASFWSIGLGFFILESSLNIALYIADFYYVSAIGIPVFFLYFSLIFLRKEVGLNFKRLLITSPIFILTILFLLNKNLLIASVFQTEFGKDVIINQLNYIVYGIFFVLYVVLAYVNLFKTYFLKNSPEEKNQLKLILWGTSIGFLFGMLFDLILPFLGDYEHIYVGPIFSLFMVGSITYAITKYRMFDMKVVVTETLVAVLWIFILVRTIISETTQDQLTNALLLASTVIVGIFIIKSVKKEVEQREKIESLAKDLERANERLKELDQLKSEFLSLATHQIRAPLTAIRGYAANVLDGDYGEIAPRVRGAVQIISSSCQNLVVIVNEFLDISRIEQGRMKYDLVSFDATALVQELITELKPNIDKTGLKIDLHVADYVCMARGDVGKIKQILGNIFDNSMKYTKHGGISISLSADEKFVTVKISDTGIGIAPEDIPKLFTKFTRAKDAFRTNVIGTGLGLYIAKQMIEAQGGKIWVESEGLGKGSTFFIELQRSQ